MGFIDSASTVSSSNTSLSFSYSVGGNSNRVIQGFVLGERSGSGTDPAVSAITYNGVAGRAVGSPVTARETTNAVSIFPYIWLETDLPSAGSNTFSVTMSTGFIPGTGTGFAMIVMEYDDVVQEVPSGGKVVTAIELSATDTITLDLSTAAENTDIAAAAIHNITTTWGSFSGGSLLHNLDSNSSRSGAGNENRASTGSPDSLSFQMSSGTWGRACMAAVELEPIGVTTITVTGSLNAALKKQQSILASVGAALASQQQRATNVDAMAQSPRTAVLNLTAILERLATVQAGLNTALLATLQVSVGLNAGLRDSAVLSANVDASLRAIKLLNASLHAAVRRGASIMTGLDASIAGGLSTTVIADLNAALQMLKTAAANFDAAVQTTGVIATNLQTVVSAENTITAALGSVLQSERSFSAQLDAVLAALQLIISLDGVVQTLKLQTAALNAVVGATGPAARPDRTSIVPASKRAATVFADNRISRTQKDGRSCIVGPDGRVIIIPRHQRNN